jgi:cysteine desulfurase
LCGATCGSSRCSSADCTSAAAVPARRTSRESSAWARRRRVAQNAWLAADGPRELAALRDRLEQGILGVVEEAGINGGAAERVPNTSNLYFDRVEAEALVIALDLKGLAVSGGSACQSGATEPSHVLTAMGLSQAARVPVCASR